MLEDEWMDASITWHDDGGKLPAVPRVAVKGMRVPLPVTTESAPALIAHCVKAPFGHGEETKLDPEVRDTWQVDAEHVAIAHPDWDTLIAEIAVIAGKSLGMGGYKVVAKLHKLLLYGPGGHFKPHQDTEKEKGMFGTLVVVLPSEYEGGELKVQVPSGKTVVVAPPSDKRAVRPHYAAFFSDCRHEVTKVRAGYRLVLAYNLIVTDLGSAEPTPSAGDPVTKRVTTALLDHFKRSRRFTHVMEHGYSLHSLLEEPPLLKGSDARVLRALVMAEEVLGRRGCSCTVTILHASAHEEVYGDEEVDPFTVEAYMLLPTGEVLARWSKDATNFLEIDSAMKLLFADMDPDQTTAQGYTGNEGGNTSKWYWRAAIIMERDDGGEDDDDDDDDDDD